MNLKKFSMLFLIFLSFLLVVGAASAEDATNSSDVVIDDISSEISTDIQNSVNASSTIQNSENQKNTTQLEVKKSAKTLPVDVDVDDVAVDYKKNNYFKVKVENDKTDKPVKNLKLNLKIFTGSKSKTYTIITNSKGIAKFNTKVLKLGNHKVTITSADSQYKITKKSNIFVGKLHSTTLKVNSKKVLKNKDTIRVYVKSDSDEKEVKVAFKKSPKYTKVVKAKFYFKNKRTGKIVTKMDNADFDHGKWELPEEDCSLMYIPVKVKVWYVQSR